jgi:hydroxymethylpyrimidine pyrophosphatase-like HAD family hydrolase
MRVGVDFHGTANAHPEYFVEVVRVLRRAGHQVGIVTAAPLAALPSIIEEWRGLGISGPDFVIGKTGVERAIPNVVWKHMVMRRARLDYLFDDLDTGRVRLIAPR